MKKYEFRNQSDKSVGSLEIKNNKLFIYGDVLMDGFFKDDANIEDICPKDIVDFLNELENQEKIEIHINSGGGSVFGGLAIYNLLKQYKGEKIVYIDGLAGSIASIIALVGDNINIYESAFFMIHDPLISLFGSYNVSDLKEHISTLQACKNAIVKIYLSNINDSVSEEDILQMMSDETWIIGADINKYFNMKVIPNKSNIVACTSDYFNNYKNMPKNIVNFYKSKNEVYDFLQDLERICIF